MEKINTELKRQIMRKVYIMAYMRRFLRPFVLKSALLSILIVVGASVVSVGNVVKNALQSGHGDIVNIVHYFYLAFTNTDIIAQTLFIGIVVLSVALLVDTVRNFNGQQVAAY